MVEPTSHPRWAEFVTRSEIRDVLARYVRGVDRLDEQLIRSCYHPDAYEVHHIFNGNAHEFAVWRAQQTFRSHHVLSESAIHFDGEDRAFVETPHRAVVHVDVHEEDCQGIAELRSSGWYLDIFMRESGTWLIKHRHVSTFERSQRLISPEGQPDQGLNAHLSALEFDLAQAAPPPSHVADAAEGMRQAFLNRYRQEHSQH